MSIREQFEAWASDEGKFPVVVERSGDSYKFMATQNKWEVWQAATNAMEAKCAALAAENAGLKKYICDECYVENIKTGATKCAGHGMPETPTTNSFLAEVRASMADEVCLKIRNAITNCYQDEQVGLDAAATICGEFAAQLRKGAAA